jgi:hypothetical protein
MTRITRAAPGRRLEIKAPCARAIGWKHRRPRLGAQGDPPALALDPNYPSNPKLTEGLRHESP